MTKLEEAKKFLESIDLIGKKYTRIRCYTLIALAKLREDDTWDKATNEWLRIHDVLEFIGENYRRYAENYRENFRDESMSYFVSRGLVEWEATSTNSPQYKYRFTKEGYDLVKSFCTNEWENKLNHFCSVHESLIEKYSSKKKMEKLPVRINNIDFTFSKGKHNQLQKAILEELAPRFAPYSECLYVGDTTKRDLVKNKEKLKELGFEITLHDKMPDVVLYREDKDWIYFIEAVTSVGPMNPKRIHELTTMTADVKSGKVFITAFLDFKTYKKFSEDLAWETEVWIAEMPDHMIHLNGDKFIGPR